MYVLKLGIKCKSYVNLFLNTKYKSDYDNMIQIIFVKNTIQSLVHMEV